MIPEGTALFGSQGSESNENRGAEAQPSGINAVLDGLSENCLKQVLGGAAQ